MGESQSSHCGRRDAEEPGGSPEAFLYVGLHDRAAVPAYLEAICEGLRAGTIVLAAGEQEFSATPDELVRVRVEGGRSAELVHVTIRLSWSEDAPGAEPSSPLSIRSQRR